MKSYLFYIFLIFPFGMVFSQVEKTEEINTNTNTNKSPLNNTLSTPVELESIKTAKKEKDAKRLEAEPMLEEISVPADPTAVDKNAESKMDSDVIGGSAVQITNYKSSFKNYSEQRTQRSLSVEQSDEMEDLLRDLSSQSPASFESYLFYYLNGQNDLTRSRALLKANELKPNDVQVQEEMLTYYVLMNKGDETRQTLLNLSQKDIYSESAELYGQDMINSAPSNSTLITHGNEDSYGAMYALKVKREREDVEIISLDWLTSPQYRTNLKIKGWKLPTSDFIDTKYLQEFCELNKDKTIAISMTLPKEYLIPILDKLYVSGLVFEYLDVPTDLSLRNQELWKTKLNKKLIDSEDKGLVNNYLPMLFQLKKIYQADGNTDVVNDIESAIQTITNR